MDSDSRNTTTNWSTFQLWSKYEDVAMHFNDLLMSLRTQALAAVAAITTFVGIFSKNDPTKTNWAVAAGIFLLLGLFWVAIWVLDFNYYNRLLLGAVDALTKLEEQSKQNENIRTISLSTSIKNAVVGESAHSYSAWKYARGAWFFYSIVFIALLGALVICLLEFSQA